jgi:hypothetical protein
LSDSFNGAWESMPRVQIKKDIQQGVLLGGGLALRCRVEITTKASEALASSRQIDIWVGKSLPAGKYKVVMKGETLIMQYSRGSWKEITSRDLPKREPGAA